MIALWSLTFPEAVFRNLPRLSSDHNLVLLTLQNNAQVYREKNFKFESFWLNDPLFDPQVRDHWVLYPYALQSKLKNLSSDIPSQTKEKGDIFVKKKRLQARSKRAQTAFQNGSHNTYLFDLDSFLSKHLNEILNQEEEYWHPRSRTNWILIYRDRNIHFFHLSTIFRRKVNKTLLLKDEVRNNISNPKNIKDRIHGHYDSIFSSESTSPSPDCTYLELFDYSQISSLAEIKEAIFSVGGSKAPGDDGFHALFYQQFWDSLKNNFLNFIKKRSLPLSVSPRSLTLCSLSSLYY